MRFMLSAVQKMQTRSIALVGAVLGLATLGGAILFGNEYTIDLRQAISDTKSFGDWEEGFDSEAHTTISDTAIILQGQRGQLRAAPYAGTSLRFGSTTSTLEAPCLDLSQADTLYIQLRSPSVQALTLQIVDKMPQGSKEPYRLMQMEIPVSQNWRTLALPIEDFQIPEWWQEQHKLPIGPQPRYKNQVCRLDFVIGDQFPKGQPFQVLIGALHTKVPRSPWPIWSGLVTSLGILLFALWKWRSTELIRRTHQAKELAEHRSIEIPIPQVCLSDWERLQQWLLANYTQTECSAGTAAQSIRMTERRIGEVVRANTGLSFREYLSHLRLTEAQNLLKQPHMQIQNVAFMAGFGHISHFNRVFKEKFGCTPREWRQQQLQHQAEEQ